MAILEVDVPPHVAETVRAIALLHAEHHRKSTIAERIVDRATAWVEDRRRDIADRQCNGFTVFHFDFDPKLTRRDLRLGEAIRYLMRVTGTRISFWRCPVRGLAVQYRQLPPTKYTYAYGETYMFWNFCEPKDRTEAKKVLVLDLLLRRLDG